MEVSFFSHAWLPGRCRTTCVRKNSFPIGWRDMKWLTLKADIIAEVLYNESTIILHSHLLRVPLLPQCIREPSKERCIKVKRSPTVRRQGTSMHVVFCSTEQGWDEQKLVSAHLCLHTLPKISYHKVPRAFKHEAWLADSPTCIYSEVVIL